MSTLIDMADDWNIVETHHILISSLFGMNIVDFFTFTGTIPSEIVFLPLFDSSRLSKFEYLAKHFGCVQPLLILF